MTLHEDWHKAHPNYPCEYDTCPRGQVLDLENATYTAAEVKVLTEAARREADGYDLVERFWEAGWPTLAACPEECGTCKPCVARWAVTWSLAALSNPDLVAKAEADGPWEWTTKPIPVTSNRPPDSRTCNCDSPNPYVGPWHAVGCCTLYAPSATYTESDMRVLTEAALRLGRKEAGEEIAERIKAEINDFPSYAWNAPDVHRGLKLGYVIAQDVASQAAPDASSGRTDPDMDSDLPPEPQAVREPQEDA